MLPNEKGKGRKLGSKRIEHVETTSQRAYSTGEL